MRHFKDIKIAVAIVMEQEMTCDLLLSLTHTSCKIADFFHHESTCFWYYNPDPGKCKTQLLKAAVFEDYRICIDYLLWVNGSRPISLQSVRNIVEAAEEKSIGGLIIEEQSDLFLLDMKSAREYCCKYPEENWFPDGSFQSFCLQFKQAGCNIEYISSPPTESGSRVQEYHLPREVNFLPNFTSSTSPKNKVYTITLNILNSIKELLAKKAIAIYGAGSVCRLLLPLIREKVRIIVDKSPELQGKDVEGFPVSPPEELKDLLEKIDVILITPLGKEEEINIYLQELLGDRYESVQVMGLNKNVKPTEQRETLYSDDSNFQVEELLKQSISQPEKTRKRELTKRGVLYVGFPCNIRCKFCYYAYSPSKEWHSIKECKRDAHLYRYSFNNERVDITGGEPTIYPHIFELLDYCKEINLIPTLITNMQVLENLEKVKQFKEHGVYDFLCSIHALGDRYDLLTQKKGAWSKLVRAVENLQDCAMKWRVNCTMTETNRPQLQKIAKISYKNGARAINFINYNPFYEWAQKMDIDFQSTHSDIQPYLKEALDYCDEVGLEANVRYYPFCKMKGHEDKCYNYSQLSYDPHEWDFCSWWSDKTCNPSDKISEDLMKLMENEEDFRLFIAQKVKNQGFCQGDACRFCAAGFICDGFTNQYVNRFGMEEMEPYEGKVILDPKWFINNQEKVIDK